MASQNRVLVRVRTMCIEVRSATIHLDTGISNAILTATACAERGPRRRAAPRRRDAATGHTGGVNDALITADGARVLTLSKDCTARVWDAATGACLHVLIGHSDTCGTAGCIRSCCSQHWLWRGGRVNEVNAVGRVVSTSHEKLMSLHWLYFRAGTQYSDPSGVPPPRLSKRLCVQRERGRAVGRRRNGADDRVRPLCARVGSGVRALPRGPGSAGRRAGALAP